MSDIADIDNTKVEISADVKYQWDENRMLVGVISDKETTLGFLLAGIGQCVDGTKNYLIADEDMLLEELEDFFWHVYQQSNICAILISYDNAKRLSSAISKCKKSLPVLIKIPTKTTLNAYSLDKSKSRRQQRRESI